MPAEHEVTRVPLTAMGSTGQIVVVGGTPAMANAARARIDDLEARWSRFRPGSEINRLAAASGRPVIVSELTFLLIERAVHAWRSTGGRFDPTVLHAMVTLGYDRTFTLVLDDPRPAGDPPPTPGCGAFVLDEATRTVTMPPGVGIDPGGIGKGLAADLVVAELLAEGAAGALVEIGGDVRASGESPSGNGWVIAIDHPIEPGAELGRVALDDGAVATSSVARRRWRRNGVTQHHVLDPSTGRPTGGPQVAATVVTGEGWWAEVLAKQVLLDGIAATGTATAAVVTMTDGRAVWSPSLRELTT